jgi:hypothetical protein
LSLWFEADAGKVAAPSLHLATDHENFTSTLEVAPRIKRNVCSAACGFLRLGFVAQHGRFGEGRS